MTHQELEPNTKQHQRVHSEDAQFLQVSAEVENNTDEISQRVLSQQVGDQRRLRQDLAKEHLHHVFEVFHLLARSRMA